MSLDDPAAPGRDPLRPAPDIGPAGAAEPSGIAASDAGGRVRSVDAPGEAVPEAPAALAGPVDASGEAPRSSAISGPRRARFASRFAAIVLDLLLLSAVQVALGWTARAAVAAAGALGRPLAGAAEIAELLAATGALVLPAVYFTALHAGEGRTVGKHLMHLRVARPDGRPIGLARSFLRWVGYEISALPFGLGFALALGPRRRALHDLLADTVVLELGPGERS
jgi:uncharacterized RDD family membrane protein YckC